MEEGLDGMAVVVVFGVESVLRGITDVVAVASDELLVLVMEMVCLERRRGANRRLMMSV